MLAILHTQQAAGNSVNYVVERYCNVRAIDQFHIWLHLEF